MLHFGVLQNVWLLLRGIQMLLQLVRVLCHCLLSILPQLFHVLFQSSPHQGTPFNCWLAVLPPRPELVSFQSFINNSLIYLTSVLARFCLFSISVSANNSYFNLGDGYRTPFSWPVKRSSFVLFFMFSTFHVILTSVKEVTYLQWFVRLLVDLRLSHLIKKLWLIVDFLWHHLRDWLVLSKVQMPKCPKTYRFALQVFYYMKLNQNSIYLDGRISSASTEVCGACHFLQIFRC